MSEETEASQLEDRAAEATAAIDTEVTAETKMRDEENAERSKLGRKVKEFEVKLGEVDSIKEQLDRLESLLGQQRQETDDEDDIVTTKTLDSYLARKESEKQTQQKKYEKDYVSSFTKLGIEDNNFDEVWSEMMERHNTVHTGDPKVDAQINYLAAANALYKKPKNPLQDKGNDIKGVNVPGETKKTDKGMPKLDPAAEEFVKKMGLGAEWVNEKLGK